MASRIRLVMIDKRLNVSTITIWRIYLAHLRYRSNSFSLSIKCVMNWSGSYYVWKLEVASFPDWKTLYTGTFDSYRDAMVCIEENGYLL